MKNLIFYIAILISSISFSQSENITNLLNNALQNELRFQSEIMAEIDSTGAIIGYTKLVDTIIVVSPFEITDNILSLITQHSLDYDEGYYIEKQVVYLDKIKAINKDIGVLFETLNNDVTVSITTYYKDGSIIESAHTSDLFRTHCVSQKNNEYIKDELIKAFQNAGYKIKSNYWFD